MVEAGRIKCKEKHRKHGSRRHPRIDTICGGVNPSGIAITKDSRYAYVCNNNNYGVAVGAIPKADSISVIDLKKKRSVTTIYDTSFFQPYTITLNKSNTKAYVTNSNSTFPGTVSIIDTETNTVSSVISGFDGPSGFEISECGTKAYVNNYGSGGGAGSGNGNTISVVDLLTETIIKKITLVEPPNPPAAPASIALTIDGKFLYVANYVQGLYSDGIVQIIRTSDDTLLQTTITGFFGPFAIKMSPNGKWAYVTNFGSNNFTPFGTNVSIIDLSNNTISTNIDVGIQPAGVTFSPDSRFAYVTVYNSLYNPYWCNPIAPNTGNFTVNILVPGQGLVVTIDTKTHHIVSTTAVGQSPGRISVTPNGKMALVSNYTSNTINLIQL